MKTITRIAALLLASGTVSIEPAMAAEPFTIASYPLFLAPAVKPNLMVIFDNSQSMDATMSGQIISGNLTQTRGNVARSVLRNVITTNRTNFNWGLTTFDINNVGLRDIFAYYLGNSATMVYTSDCVGGISASNSGRRCVPNPAGGGNYITYDRSGDDSDINDVTYVNRPGVSAMYGVGASGTTYGIYDDRVSATGTGWAGSDFADFFTDGTFSATDAGFVSNATTYPRRLWLKRGWGYRSDINGSGEIVRTVQADADGHYSSLMALLGSETANVNSGEIKNAASRTPLAGALDTVRSYYRQGESSSRPSPISQTCQANFVVLATDGNPTAKVDGSAYSDADRQIGFTPPSTYTFGAAQQDVFSRITGLRTTTLNAGNLSNSSVMNGKTVDIKTYVIGMGDSVANDKSVAALNEMAKLGGAHPTAFLGNSATSLATAFEAIVGDIQAKTSTASAAAVNAGSWNAGSRVFQAKFNSVGWSGNVLAYQVSSTGAVSRTPSWEADEKLKLMEQGQRKIITYKPSADKGVPFRWPNPAAPTANDLDSSQLAALNRDAAGSNDGHGASRLAFLRGDASREPRNCAGCSAPVFRNRIAGPLGDIVNSAPHFVSTPSSGYDDDFESSAYSSFAFTHRNRTPMIYVGANDGMLHAFNATTGDEVLAYVPSAVYDDLSKLSGSNYSHRYYVDGSPTVGDVFYAGGWRTLLVSGMRAGAKGLFALDVTNPAGFSEANAASITRWEFQDSDMGYVYGQPLLRKTNNGRWSVIVSGGYNAANSDGRAKLFVIDAETGALTRKIDTGAGTSGSPNGLSAPSAIDSNGDGVVDLVYAGDLNGNLWKFDLTSATPTSWNVGNGSEPLFAAGSSQPITGAPDITRSPKGGFVIAFGTGRYLAATDNTNIAEQRVYAVRDSLVPGRVTLSELQQQTVLDTTTQGGQEFRLSSHAVGVPADKLISTKDNLINRTNFLDSKKGWYINLPSSGERVVTDPVFRAGRLVVTSMIPDASTACAAGGSGWLLEFDAITGNRLGTPTFDISGDKAFTASDFLTFSGGVAEGRYNVSGLRTQGIPTTPAFIRSGQLDFRLIPDSNANNTNPETDPDIPPRPPASLGAARDGRAMWREVR